MNSLVRSSLLSISMPNISPISTSDQNVRLSAHDLDLVLPSNSSCVRVTVGRSVVLALGRGGGVFVSAGVDTGVDCCCGVVVERCLSSGAGGGDGVDTVDCVSDGRC